MSCQFTVKCHSQTIPSLEWRQPKPENVLSNPLVNICIYVCKYVYKHMYQYNYHSAYCCVLSLQFLIRKMSLQFIEVQILFKFHLNLLTLFIYLFFVLTYLVLVLTFILPYLPFPVPPLVIYFTLFIMYPLHISLCS